MTTVPIDALRPAAASLLLRCAAYFAKRELTLRLALATAAYPLYLLATASVARAWWSWSLEVRAVTITLDVVVAGVAVRQLLLERPRLLALRARSARSGRSWTCDDTLRSIRV